MKIGPTVAHLAYTVTSELHPDPADLLDVSADNPLTETTGDGHPLETGERLTGLLAPIEITLEYTHDSGGKWNGHAAVTYVPCTPDGTPLDDDAFGVSYVVTTLNDHGRFPQWAHNMVNANRPTAYIKDRDLSVPRP